ncbi:MAG: hypothetical protein QOI82_1086 [Actinomycetota bacterium]|nr:hypothetical protein [Actinomycetota bacterium]
MTASSASQALLQQERLALLASRMSHNVRFEQEQAARRRTERLVSVLGVVASLVAIYDLSLLTLH